MSKGDPQGQGSTSSNQVEVQEFSQRHAFSSQSLSQTLPLEILLIFFLQIAFGDDAVSDQEP